MMPSLRRWMSPYLREGQDLHLALFCCDGCYMPYLGVPP